MRPLPLTLGATLGLALACSMDLGQIEDDADEIYLTEATPTDPLPPTLGTPAASLAAAPDWLEAFEPLYAPQPPSRAELYARATAEGPKGGPLQDAILLCEVRATFFDGIKIQIGPFETENKPDLTAYLGVGADASTRGPRTRGDAHHNVDAAIVSAPLVTLKPGDRVELDVWDRDLLSRDHIETIGADYADTLPLTMTGAKARATCSALARDAVEGLVAGALQAADKGLTYHDKSWKPDLQRKDLGAEPRDPRPDLALRQAASLVGWDDPRVRARAEAWSALRARFDAALTAAVADLYASAPAPDTPIALGDRLTATVQTPICPDPSDCLLTLTVTNGGPEPVALVSFTGILDPIEDMSVLGAGGQLWPVVPADAEDPVWAAGLPPGAPTDLKMRVAVDAPIPAEARPLMLRWWTDKQPRHQRLE
ncbi:MAG: hypothetical protein H6739_40790 [Alphaproteobacteria bacterium]|nr:hypothetical protein [Alphaproteobacteria bacterium]